MCGGVGGAGGGGGAADRVKPGNTGNTGNTGNSGNSKGLSLDRQQAIPPELLQFYEDLGITPPR